VLEIDPCFAWQQQVIAGVGVAPDVKALYKDMHTYLAGTPLPPILSLSPHTSTDPFLLACMAMPSTAFVSPALSFALEGGWRWGGGALVWVSGWFSEIVCQISWV
jgi:hypothetical protein